MIEVLFNNPAVSALGWTLLHSLWQATALAALLWLVSRSSDNARLRYGLAYSTMMVQLALSIFTFGWIYEPAIAQSTIPGSVEMFAVFTAPEQGVSHWNAERLMGWVVVFWLVGLSIGSVRMGIAFGRVRRMQRMAKRAVPADFRQRVAALAQRLGYYGKLRIGISDQIGGPALLGHLKPMLIFPVAIVNQLSPEQAEAVILHELAHLSRQDHWWNLLQCIVDVLFYYHPVMWWISARIREEREHCCDDLVLTHGPGGLPYAKALLYFEQQHTTPATAVALTNSPGGLLGRVQRFLHQQNIPYQMKSRLFLLPLLTLIALISTAAYHPADEKTAPEADCTTIAPLPSPFGDRAEGASKGLPAPAESAQTLVAITPDTLPQGRHQVSSFRNGESTEVIVEDGEIKELKINGDKIPASEYERHTPMVESLLGVNRFQRRGVYSFPDNDGNLPRGFERLEQDLEGMEDRLENSGIRIERHFESMGDNWESLGERLGEMGERLGRSFEDMFEFDSNGNTFRFELRGEEDGIFEFDLDSLMRDGSGAHIFEFDSRDGGVWHLDGDHNSDDLDALIREKENATRSEEDEIREMETMIEKLERRKAEKQRELDRAKRQQADGQRQQRDLLRQDADLARQQQDQQREEAREQRFLARAQSEELIKRTSDGGVDPDKFAAIITQLQEEGLVKDSGKFKKMLLTNTTLKVNGKKVSPEAHARFAELYQERFGKPLSGSQFQIKINR